MGDPYGVDASLEGVAPAALAAAAEQVRSETGVDLSVEPESPPWGARARPVLTVYAGSFFGAIALLCLVLAVAPGAPGGGVRIFFAVLTLIFGYLAARILRRVRTAPVTVAERAREDAWRRFYQILDRPPPLRLVGYRIGPRGVRKNAARMSSPASARRWRSPRRSA